MARAVLYARCSTEEESQKDALVQQVKEAEVCIKEQGWTLADRYIESKSGTTTKGRQEYTRLYEDLLKDKFDIIVIKSQDRLMRNTKDWYLFVDRLVTEQKQLYIYISYVLTLLGYILLDIDICIFELFCIFVFIAEHLRLFLFCQFEKLVVEFNDMSF